MTKLERYHKRLIKFSLLQTILYESAIFTGFFLGEYGLEDLWFLVVLMLIASWGAALLCWNDPQQNLTLMDFYINKRKK